MTALSGFAPSTHHGRVRRPARWRAVLAVLGRMHHAVVTRRLLAQMDDRLLADIGISRSDAVAESERAPWDLLPPRR